MTAKARLKRITIYVAGWAFILLGILGLFLPILQGILFILIGLILLSSVSPWAERLLNRLKRRFPRISNQLDAAIPKARAVQRRIGAKFDHVKSKTKGVHARVFRKKKGRPTSSS